MLQPKTIEELSGIIRDAEASFNLIGTGTKKLKGNGAVLSLAGFDQVEIYEPEELILDCGAGCRLVDIQKLLAAKNQMLAFEPPDFSKLLGSQHAGTIGGALMGNLGGPRRMKAGAARDHILGLTGVNGQGEIIKAGARVVKNVTGYDIPRLMAGSYGTLMALSSVIFKTLPRPETEQSILVPCANAAEAIELMTKAMASNAEISGAAFLPGQGVALRLEGIAPSVLARLAALRQELPARYEICDEPDSQKLWVEIRDCAPLWQCSAQNIWRISIPPSEVANLIAKFEAVFDATYFLDWAGGLVWLAAPVSINPRDFMNCGHATLWRGTDHAKFHPQPPALAALSARVKAAFDPHNRLNPGLMI